MFFYKFLPWECRISDLGLGLLPVDIQILRIPAFGYCSGTRRYHRNGSRNGSRFVGCTFLETIGIEEGHTHRERYI